MIIFLCKYWAFSITGTRKARCVWTKKSVLFQALPYLQVGTSWTAGFFPSHPIPVSQAVFIQTTHLHHRNLSILNCIYTQKKPQRYTPLKHWMPRQKGWDPTSLGSSCQQLNQKDGKPETWNFSGTSLITHPFCFQQGADFGIHRASGWLNEKEDRGSKGSST